ncbi:sigma-70 family RNA polymerase sigma factor [Pectobacterium actinidiae]|uniref:sigma-70 family RNA polymerase sigma factor n=1 Tax=Pectobacterium actinidiae TaxID=1507808 RepID=UPI0037F1B634
MSDGQHSALFVTLYGHHHTWLRHWLYRRLGCNEAAADLTQDTFVRVLNKPSLDELKQPRAYLSTIAYSLFVNLLRRRQLERSYLEALAQLPETLTPSPEERWQLFEVLQEVDEMLDGLPVKVRTAFLLSQLDGLTHREIAERLHVSKSSVRHYIAQALLRCMAAVAGKPCV